MGQAIQIAAKNSMNWKTLLFTLHRWLGIAMCLLFAAWFASGIVMMYVEYPELTYDEYLATQPGLNLEGVNLTPSQALSGLGVTQLVGALSLGTVLDQPAYQFTMDDGSLLVVFADSGRPLDGLSEERAVEAALLSGFSRGDTDPRHTGLIERDQWTVSEVLDPARPLHRVALNDSAGTVLYVSDRTGQVVRDTNAQERFWNWLGSTVHWIYPVQIREHRSLWVNLVIYVSLLGLVSIVTGTIIGIMRLRIRKPYRGRSYSPYTGMMKWHHVLGLITVVFVFTFTFSGLMSMGPWGIFDSRTSAQPQILRYTGQDYLRLHSLPSVDVLRDSNLESPVKEVSWHYVNGEPYLVATLDPDTQHILFSDDAANNSSRLLTNIRESIPNLLPDSRLLQIDVLNEYDDYYYGRHNSYRPLPVYRARFDDEENTWYHIDMDTGEAISRVTDASRLERWLFNGMHSLDLQLLWRQRPLWDVLVILLSLAGLAFSVTSVVVGWRYLRGKKSLTAA